MIEAEACEQRMLSDAPPKRFAVALSFPRAHRTFVRRLALKLADQLGKDRIFFDEWYQAELHGTGADLKLKAIYKDQSTLVVPFFSKHYQRMWCQIEWHAIRALLAERRSDDAVVPVHMDDTKVEGWESIDLGIRKGKCTAEVVATRIAEIYRHRSKGTDQTPRDLSPDEVSHPPRSDNAPNVIIRVGSTRNGRRQLASFHIFNPGPRPFLVSSWFATWADHSGKWSLTCLDGTLPKRLKDQESLQLLVDISDHPVEELKALGICGGDNRRWPVDDAQVENLIRVAQQHALPPLPDSPASQPARPSAEINVRASEPDSRGSRRLEVIVSNTGQAAFTPIGGELKWEYSPPRWGPKVEGKPQVAELGGSVSLRLESKAKSVQPNGQAVLFLDAFDCPMLVSLLSDDVVEEKIQFIVGLDNGFAWTVHGDEVPQVVREVARNALELEHGRP